LYEIARTYGNSLTYLGDCYCEVDPRQDIKLSQKQQHKNNNIKTTTQSDDKNLGIS